MSLSSWYTWWPHQMETFSALLAICAGNSPVTGEFRAQRPVTRNFDVFFDLRLNKRLSKQSWGWWFETLSHPSWLHRNVAGINDPVILHFCRYFGLPSQGRMLQFIVVLAFSTLLMVISLQRPQYYQQAIGKPLIARNYTPILHGNVSNRIFIWGVNRLGNQLFQYAMIWTVAKRTGRPVLMVSDRDFKGMFPGLTVPVLVASRELRKKLKAQTQKGPQGSAYYEKTFIDDIPTGTVELQSTFASFRYLWQYRDQLKKELTFSDSLQANAERIRRSAHLKLLGDDKVQSTRFVAVHIRRGDFVDQYNYNIGRRAAPPSYFHKSMTLFRNTSRERVLFIVTSDDPKWAEKHLQSNDTYVSTGGSAAEDMALLASCNDTIYSSGTYGWWAAFFTPGRKVYFRDGMAKDSFIIRKHTYNDTYPPDWITMGN